MRELAILLLGGLLGAGTAVLSARRTGRETRDELARRVTSGFDALKERTRLRATQLMQEAPASAPPAKDEEKPATPGSEAPSAGLPSR